MSAPDAKEPSSPQLESVDVANSIQAGVCDAEALTSAWTKKSLIAAYLMCVNHTENFVQFCLTCTRIFLIFFVDSFQQETTGSLAPYVTSAFKDHALLSTTSVLTSIIGGVSKLPIARIIDVWGRPEGFVLMTLLCTLGIPVS